MRFRRISAITGNHQSNVLLCAAILEIDLINVRLGLALAGGAECAPHLDPFDSLG